MLGMGTGIACSTQGGKGAHVVSLVVLPFIVLLNALKPC